MLDNSFPYPNISMGSVPVNTTLISNDSPGTPLERSSTKTNSLGQSYTQYYDKYTRTDNFSTFLIYKPEGKKGSTIWVTLSVINWGWYGTAEYVNNQWGLTSGDKTGGGNGTATSVLPEWNDNVINHTTKWIDI